MAGADVKVVLGAEFVGKKAFNDALKSTVSLQSQVRSLAKSYLGLFTAQKLITEGVQAVKAFAQDEAAALRLSTAVDNLGISFANPQIANFISSLEKSAAIADDILRPAFQGLLTTTGSLTQSQKLLNDAITISRGTGVDLATVSDDLAKGYVGITKGLKKYNTGLTTAELSSKSFSEILGVLLKQSSGAANAYLDTTSFKFDTLTIATDNAREMIGKGLVDALARAGGGTEAVDAIATMNNIAKAINAITLAAGTAVGAIPSLIGALKKLPSNIVGGFAASAGAKRGVSTLPTVEKPKAVVSKTARELALAKLEKDAAKRAKELAALTKKQTSALKEQTALQKAGTIFDIEQAQILAALKGNISAEERKRLELQLAIITGNTSEASKLAGELAIAQGLTKDLADYLANRLPAAKNPFMAWKSYLDEIELQAARIAAMKPVTPASIAGNPMTPAYNGAAIDAITASYGTNAVSARADASGNVNVYVGGSVVSEADLVEAVSNGLLNRSLSGSPSAIGRLKGSFAG
jgi:hypothetical protein